MLIGFRNYKLAKLMIMNFLKYARVCEHRRQALTVASKPRKEIGGYKKFSSKGSSKRNTYRSIFKEGHSIHPNSEFSCYDWAIHLTDVGLMKFVSIRKSYLELKI